MAEKVIIVESPAKSKTISSYFNNEVLVLSSVGHIRDLKTSGKDGLGVNVDEGFEPDYGIIKGKNTLIKDLIKQTKNKQVYLATDPDREGEAIAWHLAQVLGIDLNQENRVVFREITKPAILEAINHPKKIDLELVDSQETRRILDRIIGFRLSSLLRRKNSGNPTAGRVQSVALKLVCDLEREIQAFIPEEYYNIYAHFNNEIKAEYIIKAKTRIKKDEADRIVAGSTNPFVVEDLIKKEASKKPRAPYITSTLQQDAYNQLSMSAARFSRTAQRLYEGIEIDGELVGLITYMRTDSNRLSPLFTSEATNYIKANYGEKYLGKLQTTTKGNAQDAHEAIRPTSVKRTPDSIKEYLSDDEYRLYKKIYEHTLASLMTPAVYENSKLILVSNKEFKYQLEGTRLIFDGYHRVLADVNKEKSLPNFKVGDTITANQIEAIQKFTQPPARYNEASLIKDLESKGIGRPSTYSAIINILKDEKRNYVKVEEKRFIPTEQGFLIYGQLDKYFDSIINEEYTAKLEDQLDNIADGNQVGVEVLSKFYQQFIPLLETADQGLVKQAAVVTGQICPECGSNLVIRKSRYGEFLGCSNFPKCKHIEPIIPSEEKS